LFPIEGQFLSVTDKSYVLGLPASKREELLKDRASQVIRREQARQLRDAIIAAHKMTENCKKRKTEAETEDRAPQTTETQEFTVHRHLVCANSKFFKAACSKLWAEGEEKIVRLPEVKVDAFQAYLVWVYTGKVVFNGEAPRHKLRAIIDLYLLGDILDDLLLRNTAMRSLVIHIPGWSVIPSVGLVNHIWASTPAGSPLRQVIIDIIVKRVGRANLERCVTVDHPAEFLHDMAVVLLKQVPTVSAERFISGMNGYLEAEPSNNTAKTT
jgi:hypothetical protein